LHRPIVVAAGLALALISACGSTPSLPSASALTDKPIVAIQAPTDGAIVGVGQDVTVTGGASDTVGVDHVALFADGVSVAGSPGGHPATLVPFSLTWLATPAGPHVLQAVAYRADGTSSDPAVVNVTVGSGSFPAVSGGSLPPFSFPAAGNGGLITPAPTKKPKPTHTTSVPTLEPTTPPSTSPTDTPPTSATAMPAPTASQTPLPTKDASGNAPFDPTTEPHVVVLDPTNAAQCPADITGIPMAAIGCVWEQISAPAGDSTDEVDFALSPNTTYKMQLTSCSDASDLTVFLTPGQDPSIVTGCGDWQIVTTGATAGATQMIVLTFTSAPTQLYNLYQMTVYQCQFANCGTQ
jgi:Big-like domain-containing protein